MKKILFCLLITLSLVSRAQVYNNEWIDYTKTYYKFKVGKTGVYRIPQSVLFSAGLGSTPAENFQLWRNGRQVPLFTSTASGVLTASDYIEFWGLMNDGKPDQELYRVPAFQLNDKWSLETDTAAFFLTVNPNAAQNRRLNTTPNNVTGNTLPAEPWFLYTFGNYFRYRVIRDTLVDGVLVNDTLINTPMQNAARSRPGNTDKDLYMFRMNSGFAVNVGENLFSSSYDKGEGFTSNELISQAFSTSVTYGQNNLRLKNLFAAPSGPAPLLRIAASGNGNNYRRFKVEINGDSVYGKRLDFFEYTYDSTYFPLNDIKAVNPVLTVTNISEIACYPAPVGCQTDRMVVHKYEIVYPRLFNFGGEKNFEFTMPASSSGNYLEITNFNSGSSMPVLYDLTNDKRYAADLDAAPLLRFVLAPSATARQLVLVSEDATNINTVSQLETRNFIDYISPSVQSNYMIISHPALFSGPNGTNPVEEYRQYRSSAQGGSYSAKVYLIDELIDQFGLGIKKNPAAVRNFIRYARNNFAAQPKHVFIIGKGVIYTEHRGAEMAPEIEKLDFIPPFGRPASDVLLTADPGSSIPKTPIGRLSAINGQEVSVYLKKVKDFEAEQAMPSGLIADKGWTKNIVHIIGAGDPGLDTQLTQNMRRYEFIIRDTLFGAEVSTFSKSSNNFLEQLNSARLNNLFTEGISLITYFGHSSSSTLEFNLDNPQNYNNYQKYPLFIGLGCNAGDFFKFNTSRLQTKETLSEKYVLAQDRGTIGFVASTHFGIVHYLDIWASRAYRELASKSYNKSLGEFMMATAESVFNFTGEDDFYARCNTEQSELHGDPAIHLNTQAKPDYVIEESMVRSIPGFVSVDNQKFKLNIKFLNLGKAIDKKIVVEVKRQVPDHAAVVILRDTIDGIRYMDTMTIEVPIHPITDKGINKFTVTIDRDNDVDEVFENNNSVTKDIMIYEDEARPVYPYNYAIINTQNVKFVASTADPFAASKQYIMEIDTTELFNSPAKLSSTITSAGGSMEFIPGITFTDSTVYFWRVAPVTNNVPVWNSASFIYLPNSEVGFNQSHLHQHIRSSLEDMSLDTTARLWKFGTRFMNLFIKQGTWVTSTGQEAGLSVSVNDDPYMRNTCYFQSVVFNVFDPITFQPWINTTLQVPNGTYPTGLGRFGSSANNCSATRLWNFEFRWDSTLWRKNAMNFMKDTIPDGAYVVVRSFLLDPNTYPSFANLLKYANQWKTEDEAAFGPGNSLYYSLLNAGFSGIDSFYKPRQFVLIYKKNDLSFTPKWIVSDGTLDNITLSADCEVPDTVGIITSPRFGPAKSWKQLFWGGQAMESVPGDHPQVSVIGIMNNGEQDTLIQDLQLTQQIYDISSIDPVTYPYIQLRLRNADNVNNTPYQLKYWRLTYDPAPEGVVAPNAYLYMNKDTVDVAEPIDFKVAFKNVSPYSFPDSVKVKVTLTDRNNVPTILPYMYYKPLVSGDTFHVHTNIDTRLFTGANSLFLEVNPDDDQPEQYHFNNYAYKGFYVRGDSLNPLLDVTFDNIHIINHDIVSPKPNIQIKLRDEAKWYRLDDPSKLKVILRKMPKVSTDDIVERQFAFDGDTLQFIPAAPNPDNNNSATALFKPVLEDGTYELVIKGKDMSENAAGPIEYKVTFEVFNKAMISNMLNYPNPFTTSTAFVFTLTGSEVPQNIKIQILTVTGKVVREITKEELGPLRIGRNITEFKWDGTDQYGQRLANGVYLYRVVTNLNGKSLDKYTSKYDETDQYFNKGYGKMYLMR